MRLLICFLLALTGWAQTGIMRVQRRTAAGPYAPTISTKSVGTDTEVAAGDTTGATLLTAVVSAYTAGMPSACDSTYTPIDCFGAGPCSASSNTWVAITPANQGLQTSTCIWYAANPTVGANHRFRCSGQYPSCFFQAWPSIQTSTPLDAATVSGGVSSGSDNSINTGTVTPGSNNEVCLAGGAEYVLTESGFSFDSPSQAFTLLESQVSMSGTNAGGAAGFYAQGTATALSTTYTFTGTAATVETALACFKR